MKHISFHGAAKQVTGSCHLVECGDYRLLIDCGLFQGGREIDEDNAADFGFDPASIDFLLLTHAHLDHCGRIPLLVQRGFRGEIITTAASRELARLVMTDAASLEEEDARRRSRREHRHGRRGHQPLFTLDDAFHAMDFFGRTAHYDQPLTLAEGIEACFIDAGHIIGSAAIALTLVEDGQPTRVLFSGDLGGPDRPLLRDPTPPPPVDYVVIESTYGDRNHRGRQDSVSELHEAINDTLARGGNVIIPTFALERAQEVLHAIGEGIRGGHLPPHLPVFLDSPMAISATDIFRRHPECFDEDFAHLATRTDGDPFALPGLRYTRDTADSMAINTIERGAVILAGSGMCTGGRVRHHLKHHLWRERSSIVFVGYAAQGTLARRIIDGAKTVRLFGDEIRVRARIWTINGFSAHAGQDELLSWFAHTGKPRCVYIVHGEPDRGMAALAEALAARGIHYHIPGMHERVLLHA